MNSVSEHKEYLCRDEPMSQNDNERDIPIYLCKKYHIQVFGVCTCTTNVLIDHEKKSLDIFNRMFFGVTESDVKTAYNVLREKHPYYNGNVYEKIVPYTQYI